MKLVYIGPKEIISHHGIDFKSGKDDKYVYINYAMNIYNAIHHDYKKNIIYTHTIEDKTTNDEIILERILSLKPSLQVICEKEIQNLSNLIDKEIKHIENLDNLTNEEKETYKNNQIIMRNYRLQRETNKIIYNHLIEIVVDDILDKRLKEINTPFNEKFWHCLQSVQGELSNHNKRSIGSKLTTIHKEIITISLKINSIGK